MAKKQEKIGEVITPKTAQIQDVEIGDVVSRLSYSVRVVLKGEAYTVNPYGTIKNVPKASVHKLPEGLVFIKH